MANKNEEVSQFYIPSMVPAIILIVSWGLYYNFGPKEMVNTIPSSILFCAIIYGFSYMFLGGKTVKVRKMTPMEVEREKEAILEKVAPVKEIEKTKTSKATLQAEQHIIRIAEYQKSISSLLMKQDLKEIVDIVQQIMDYLSEHLDQEPSMRKFLDSYLPTLINLLDIYSKFEMNQEVTEEMKKTLVEIETTTQSVKDALQKKLHDLYQVEAVDANANMSALKTMLNQDGLLEEEISLNKE